jgi:pyridoxine/pyridoxamine 5'-phosphate oxidase
MKQIIDSIVIYCIIIGVISIGLSFHLQGAARRGNTQRKTVEVESVAAAGKPETREVVKKSFRAEVTIYLTVPI